MLRYGLLLGFFLLISISLAENNSATYQDNGLSFKIPLNWSVAEVEHLNETQADGSPINDTKIVLSDGKSAIRIDIVDMPQMSWILSFYEKDNTKFPWFIEAFYRTNVIKKERGCTSSVGLPAKPDGVSNLGFSVCRGDQDEWIIAWTKPSYKNKFIGVRAIFDGIYPMKYDNRGGYDYTMQSALYELLESLSTNFSLSEGNEKMDIVSRV